MTEFNNKKIGFIGSGNMGEAIIAGLSNSINPNNIFVFDIDEKKLIDIKKKYVINICESNNDLSKKSDFIFLSVKPDKIFEVLDEIKSSLNDKKLLVSIAAGINLDSIENTIGSKYKIIRAMPNTPALIGEGMTVISPNKKADDESLNSIEFIFSHIGKVLVLKEELMDTVTGLSGSGPAYVFTFIQAMIDGGVKMGLPRDKARTLTLQTIIGAAKLVEKSGEDPISLRGKVTSPGGTTIEAVHVLEKSGFSGKIMDAIESATNKSRNLGAK